MGNDASKIKTLQILKINENSVSHKNNILPFMHTIIKYNDKPIKTNIDALEINKEWEDDDLVLELRDLRTDTDFSLTIPKKNGEKLGMNIKFHDDIIKLFTIKILSTVSGSPADMCGLVRNDYILGVENVSCENENELLKYIECKKKAGMPLLVFNPKLNFIRKVDFKVPSGLGFFGCEIGLGILYRIPADERNISMEFDKDKINEQLEKLRQKQEESSDSGSEYMNKEREEVSDSMKENILDEKVYSDDSVGNEKTKKDFFGVKNKSSELIDKQPSEELSGKTKEMEDGDATKNTSVLDKSSIKDTDNRTFEVDDEGYMSDKSDEKNILDHNENESNDNIEGMENRAKSISDENKQAGNQSNESKNIKLENNGESVNESKIEEETDFKNQLSDQEKNLSERNSQIQVKNRDDQDLADKTNNFDDENKLINNKKDKSEVKSLHQDLEGRSNIEQQVKDYGDKTSPEKSNIEKNMSNNRSLSQNKIDESNSLDKSENVKPHDDKGKKNDSTITKEDNHEKSVSYHENSKTRSLLKNATENVETVIIKSDQIKDSNDLEDDKNKSYDKKTQRNEEEENKVKIDEISGLTKRDKVLDKSEIEDASKSVDSKSKIESNGMVSHENSFKSVGDNKTKNSDIKNASSTVNSEHKEKEEMKDELCDEVNDKNKSKGEEKDNGMDRMNDKNELEQTVKSSKVEEKIGLDEDKSDQTVGTFKDNEEKSFDYEAVDQAAESYKGKEEKVSDEEINDKKAEFYKETEGYLSDEEIKYEKADSSKEKEEKLSDKKTVDQIAESVKEKEEKLSEGKIDKTSEFFKKEEDLSDKEIKDKKVDFSKIEEEDLSDEEINDKKVEFSKIEEGELSDEEIKDKKAEFVKEKEENLSDEEIKSKTAESNEEKEEKLSDKDESGRFSDHKENKDGLIRKDDVLKKNEVKQNGEEQLTEIRLNNEEIIGKSKTLDDHVIYEGNENDSQIDEVVSTNIKETAERSLLDIKSIKNEIISNNNEFSKDFPDVKSEISGKNKEKLISEKEISKINTKYDRDIPNDTKFETDVSGRSLSKDMQDLGENEQNFSGSNIEMSKQVHQPNEIDSKKFLEDVNEIFEKEKETLHNNNLKQNDEISERVMDAEDVLQKTLVDSSVKGKYMVKDNLNKNNKDINDDKSEEKYESTVDSTNLLNDDSRGKEELLKDNNSEKDMEQLDQHSKNHTSVINKSQEETVHDSGEKMKSSEINNVEPEELLEKHIDESKLKSGKTINRIESESSRKIVSKGDPINSVDSVTFNKDLKTSVTGEKDEKSNVLDKISQQESNKIPKSKNGSEEMDENRNLISKGLEEKMHKKCSSISITVSSLIEHFERSSNKLNNQPSNIPDHSSFDTITLNKQLDDTLESSKDESITLTPYKISIFDEDERKYKNAEKINEFRNEKDKEENSETTILRDEISNEEEKTGKPLKSVRSEYNEASRSIKIDSKHEEFENETKVEDDKEKIYSEEHKISEKSKNNMNFEEDEDRIISSIKSSLKSETDKKEKISLENKKDKEEINIESAESMKIISNEETDPGEKMKHERKDKNVESIKKESKIDVSAYSSKLESKISSKDEKELEKSARRTDLKIGYGKKTETELEEPKEDVYSKRYKNLNEIEQKIDSKSDYGKEIETKLDEFEEKKSEGSKNKEPKEDKDLRSSRKSGETLKGYNGRNLEDLNKVSSCENSKIYDKLHGNFEDKTFVSDLVSDSHIQSIKDALKNEKEVHDKSLGSKDLDLNSLTNEENLENELFRDDNVTSHTSDLEKSMISSKKVIENYTIKEDNSKDFHLDHSSNKEQKLNEDPSELVKNSMYKLNKDKENLSEGQRDEDILKSKAQMTATNILERSFSGKKGLKQSEGLGKDKVLSKDTHNLEITQSDHTTDKYAEENYFTKNNISQTKNTKLGSGFIAKPIEDQIKDRIKSKLEDEIQEKLADQEKESRSKKESYEKDQILASTINKIKSTINKEIKDKNIRISTDVDEQELTFSESKKLNTGHGINDLLEEEIKDKNITVDRNVDKTDIFSSSERKEFFEDEKSHRGNKDFIYSSRLEKEIGSNTKPSKHFKDDKKRLDIFDKSDTELLLSTMNVHKIGEIVESNNNKKEILDLLNNEDDEGFELSEMNVHKE